MNDIIPATNDVIFKALFVRNPDLLKSFLSAVLKLNTQEIKNIKIINPELPPNYADFKSVRLDILLETKTETINIEMQSTNKEDYKERVLFYWARIYSDELKKGRTYDKVRRCICINILNFKMFECKEYHSAFSVREDSRNELLTDKLHFYFFELPKISKKPDKNDFLQLWLQLFKANKRSDFDMLKSTDIAEIQKGADVICLLSEDEIIREQARQREIAETNYRSDIANAERRAREQVAINLLKLKTMSNETIASVSGLSIEQIDKLASETE